MTSNSELFVEEVIRDKIERKVRSSGYPVGFFSVRCPQDWRGIEEEAEYPDRGEAAVYDGGGKQIGRVYWDIRFEIEGDHNGRFITATPRNVRFIPAGHTRQKSRRNNLRSQKKTRGCA